tara:strand:- start:681 stop:941 length:261 start_codon:yes stop_codon:yes gene_type:complete
MSVQDYINELNEVIEANDARQVAIIWHSACLWTEENDPTDIIKIHGGVSGLRLAQLIEEAHPLVTASGKDVEWFLTGLANRAKEKE